MVALSAAQAFGQTPVHTVAFAQGASSAIETPCDAYAGGQVPFVPLAVTVNIAPPASADFVLEVAIAGTAALGVDYYLPASVNVAAGDTSVTMRGQIYDDRAPEGDETVELSLVSGSGYAVGRQASHALAIIDDEAAAIDLCEGPSRVATVVDEAPALSPPTTASQPDPPEDIPAVFTGPVFGNEPNVREILETAQPGAEVGAPIPLDDPGKGDVTYSLAGPDEHLFVIDDSGQIIVADGAAFDYETDNRLVVRVTAKDKGGDTATATVTIHVLDVNEPPVLDEFDVLEVREDAPAGKTVGEPAATDPEGDAITYSLEGDDAFPFGIDPDSGRISVSERTAENPGLDFETKASHTFAVVATDPDGAATRARLTVGVLDVAPAFVDVDRLEIAENSPGGRTVGEPVTAEDPGGNAIAYALAAPDAPFVIDPDTGQLSLADAAALDFETRSSHAVMVHATVGERSASIGLTVYVIDIDEAPGRPGTPTLVSQVGSDILDAQWGRADASGRPPVTRYELQYRRHDRGTPGDWATVAVPGDRLARRLEALASNTSYEARVRAHNDEGISEWSDIGHGATAVARLAIRFGAGEVPVPEGGSATLTVFLAPAADREVEVPVTVSQPTDTLAGIPASVFFARGTSAVSFDLTAGQDDYDVQDHSTVLGFGALPARVERSVPATVRITVVDDDKRAQARMRRLNLEILGRQALGIMADANTAVVDRSGDVVSERDVAQVQWGHVGGRASARGAGAPAGGIAGRASFSVPLRAGRVWGIGSRQALDGAVDLVGWNGYFTGAQLGVDKEVLPNVRAGLAASWSEGDFTYEDSHDGGHGVFDSSFVSLHPYLGLHRPNGQAWGTVGYGSGDVAILDDGRTAQSSSLAMRAAAAGGRRHLASGAGASWQLDVQGDTIFARVDVSGRGLIPADTLDVSRMRVALSGKARWALAGSDQTWFITDAELGARRDVGFSSDGQGMEVGAGLAYVNRGMGLTVEGRGRAFLFGAVDEWGLQGLVRIDPQFDRLGLSVLVRPAWGPASGGVHQLWSEGLSSLGGNRLDATPRIAADIGYGVSGGRGIVTPFATLRFGATNAYRIGVRYEGLDRLHVRVESEHRRAFGGGVESAFLLRLWLLDDVL